MADHLDLLVIGGGAGGLTAAREAARRGATAGIVQDGPLGGDCTFTGCVPSKTLLHASARGVDFAEAMATVRAAVARVAASEDDDALRQEGVAVFHGRARLRSPTEIEVGGERIRSSRIIVATGARPVVPPIAGVADADPLTSETVWDLPSLPGRLAVLGGGAIGVELGQAFARLGSAVTVIEAEDRVLPAEEPEASAAVTASLVDDGVTVCTGARLEHVALSGNALSLRLDDGQVVGADRLLVAVGRRPTTEGLGLEEIGVALDEQGNVRTDPSLATSVRGIWAVGDVTGRMPFTHAAARMGFIAARNALSRWGRIRPQRFEAGSIPWVTYTSPEVGRVGVTEAEAAAGRGGRVAFLPLEGVDRAVAAGEERGFVKLIAGSRRLIGNTGGGRIIGATIVAPTGGELVHEPALAMSTGMFTGRLAQATHAYPSWSMAIQQAATQFFFTLDGRRARPARRSEG